MSRRNEQTIGEAVPDLLTDLLSIGGGRVGPLRAAVAGKRAAVVVFWSGICSHCARYDEFLNSFTTRYPAIALVVIACRQEESRQDVQTTAARRGLCFPILYDTDRHIAHAWLVQQTPRVFLLDSDLRLAYRGAIDNFKYPADPDYRPYLEQAIDNLLGGRPITRAETPSFGCAIESVYYSLPKPVAPLPNQSPWRADGSSN